MQHQAISLIWEAHAHSIKYVTYSTPCKLHGVKFWYQMCSWENFCQPSSSRTGVGR